MVNMRFARFDVFVVRWLSWLPWRGVVPHDISAYFRLCSSPMRRVSECMRRSLAYA